MSKRPKLPPAAEPGKAARAKAELLRAAIALFGQLGPEGTTVRDIAKAARQNVAAIAYHFGGKDQLYRAALSAIVEGMHRTLGDLLQEARGLPSSGPNLPDQAERLLEKLLTAIYLRLLSRDDSVPLVQIIVREQLGPTEAFDVLYESGFHELHKTLCRLVGLAAGLDPDDRETIVRTHLLMGQVYFFAMSREAILRRLGWKTLEGKNSALVTSLLEEHIRAVLVSLRRKSRLPQKD